MSCEQTTFSLMLMKMQREKRLRSQKRRIVVNVNDYFKKLNRHQWTQGPLTYTADTTRVYVPASR